MGLRVDMRLDENIQGMSAPLKQEGDRFGIMLVSEAFSWQWVITGRFVKLCSFG